MSQTIIQETLAKCFEKIKRVNPYYSQRSYAKKLGVSSGTLSLIMRGKRRISKDMAIKFSSALGLDTEELKNLISTFSNPHKPNQQNLDIKYIYLKMNQFKVISSWYHFAILSLLKLDNFKSDPKWIAQRLGITENQTKAALDRLIHTGLISYKNKTYIRNTNQLSTSDDIKNEVLMAAHRDNLKIAEKKLEEVDTSKRDYTALTMAIDPNKIPKAKQMIRDFQDRLDNFLESDNKTEVYRLCMQFFPLTKENK